MKMQSRIRQIASDEEIQRHFEEMGLIRRVESAHQVQVCGFVREGAGVYLRHVWAADWCEGDTCLCGAHYVKTGSDGGMEMLSSLGEPSGQTY